MDGAAKVVAAGYSAVVDIEGRRSDDDNEDDDRLKVCSDLDLNMINRFLLIFFFLCFCLKYEKSLGIPITIRLDLLAKS